MKVRMTLIAFMLMPLMVLASSLYMVINLAEGVSAEKYPVTYLDDVPAGGWTDDYKTTKLVMRRIEPGTYMMGSPDDELGHSSGSETLHQVTLTEAFYVGVFEITQRQWELVMGTRPSYFNNASYYATRPVEQTTYTMIRGNSKGAQWPNDDEVDADSFIGRVRSKAGLRFDLPTEAQWEYACRAGTTTALNSGKNLTSKGCCANMSAVGRYYYNGGYNYSTSCTTDYGTAKVGSYLPNSWGLYDMHGNVWEYCLDRYCPHINCSHLVASTDPIGATTGTYIDINTSRIARGGSWNWDAYDSRSAQRYAVSAPFEISNNNHIGLRLALTIADNAASESITYNPGSLGSGSQQMATKNHGVALILEGAIFTRTGYTQTGWSTTDGGSQEYGLGASYTEDAAITLYPVWTRNTLPDGGPYTEIVDGIEWTFMVQNGEARVGTGTYDGPAISKSTVGDVSIPPTLGGRTVVRIGVYAFNYCTALTCVQIPSCLEDICQNGFAGCSALTNVTISSGVKSVGSAAFWYCNSLACVSIPASVTNVAGSAFGRCRGLERFYVADDNAFYSSQDGVLFDKLKTKLITYSAAKKGSYDVPDGVTEIGESAFDECSGLTAVTLPFGVSEIGANAFMGCTGLSSVDIPSSVTYIGSSAFAGCDGLIEITIPSAVTSIGQYAFFGCSQLEAIEVSDANTSFTAVDGVLFNKSMTRLITCPAKKTGSYTIPAGVKSLDWYAFFECRGLDSITIPSSVTELGLCPFSSCSGLNSVDFEGAPPEGLSDSELEADVAIRYNAAYADEWEQAIAECGFTNATPYTPQKPDGGPYTEVVDGVEWTFMVADGEASVGTGEYGGTAVEASLAGGIAIPSVLGGRTVTGIGDNAFRECYDLTEIIIPDSVVSIGDHAFYNCDNIVRMEIPQDVSYIGSNPFGSCTSLVEIAVSEHNQWFSSVDGVVFNKDGTELMICPCGKKGLYVIPSSVIRIGDQAFDRCSKLTDVTIPSGVTTVGDFAFNGCEGLSDLDIPSSVTHIGTAAFQFCRGLTDAVISTNVVALSNYMFANCAGLKSMTIPQGVTSIGEYSFGGCSSLEIVSVPTSVTGIATNAFGYSPVREVCVGIGEADRVGGLLAGSGMDLQDVVFVEPSNRIEYRETRGAQNNNPTNVWISTGIVFEPLSDVTGWQFAGWSPAEVPAGHVGDVVVTAQWVAIGTTPPDWKDVTKGDTLTVYAAVSNRQTRTLVEAAGSLLAAFDQTGECRGVTEIEEGPFGAFFQLSVGIESTAETGFTLKVWDAATGEITEIATTFDANPDKVLGAFDDLIVYEIGLMTQTVTLNEGWTWISFSLLPDDSMVGTLFAGLTFANGDVIKASNKTITYYNGVWYPSAYSLTPGKAYMVRKSAGGADSVDVAGVPMSDGLTFAAGWNWFGPTTLGTQTIATVTHTGGFVNKDMVKSSSKTATWYGGKWYSADFQLCPGCGYVAKFANAGTIYFGEVPSVQTSAASLPMCASRMTLAAIGNGKPLWKEVTKGDNMTVYASVHNLTTDANVVSDGSLLAAFDASGECRGVAAVEDGPCGKVFQLTVGIESTDETGFVLKIWDAASNSLYDIIEKFDANAQKQIGEINDPIVYTTQDASALIPDLGENPTTEAITNVFVEAKAEDPKLAEKITTEAAYTNFSAWAKKVQPHGGGEAVGAAGVMAAPHAWMSYALGSETLLETAPTDADLTVEAFEPKSGEDGKFDFTVSVKDVEVGGAATTEAQKEQVKENLKQVFGLEGGTTLETGGMSSENVDITFGTPQDGKVKFTAGPKDTEAKTFFMKVRVK